MSHNKKSYGEIKQQIMDYFEIGELYRFSESSRLYNTGQWCDLGIDSSIIAAKRDIFMVCGTPTYEKFTSTASGAFLKAKLAQGAPEEDGHMRVPVLHKLGLHDIRFHPAGSWDLNVSFRSLKSRYLP